MFWIIFICLEKNKSKSGHDLGWNDDRLIVLICISIREMFQWLARSELFKIFSPVIVQCFSALVIQPY